MSECSALCEAAVVHAAKKRGQSVKWLYQSCCFQSGVWRAATVAIG